MPENNSRSPCRLQESAPAPKADQMLRETRKPERAHLNVRTEARGDSTVTLLDVDVATVARVNSNRRYYSREVWEGAIAAAQDDITGGRLWGLLEHPDGWDDPMKGELANIGIRYETLTLDGDIVKATGVIVETQAGQDLKALINGGIAVGISSNGTATVQYLPAREVILDYPNPDEYLEVIQPDFRLLTIDAVGTPSDAAGRARKKERQERKEQHMNPKLKKMLEALKLTEAEFKAQYAEEYAALTATPAAPAQEQASGDNRAVQELTNKVIELTGKLEASERRTLESTRRGIALSKLEAAKLPAAPKVGDLDLDATFKAELEGLALTAESDEKAAELVDGKIAERRALLGTPKEAAKPVGKNGVNLPAGDSSAPARTESASGSVVRSVRANVGLN